MINCVDVCSRAQCNRYEHINQGGLLGVYNDDTGFLTGYYPLLTQTSQNYVEIALSRWNAAYPCGDLFEIVDDPSNAWVVVSYVQDETLPWLGQAGCFCPVDGTQCSETILDDFWSEGDPTTVMLNFRQALQGNTTAATEQYWLNILTHEFGHILGMGHVYDAGISSVLGLQTPEDRGLIKSWDIYQLLLRYPCCNYLPVSPEIAEISQVTESPRQILEPHLLGCDDSQIFYEGTPSALEVIVEEPK